MITEESRDNHGEFWSHAGRTDFQGRLGMVGLTVAFNSQVQIFPAVVILHLLGSIVRNLQLFPLLRKMFERPSRDLIEHVDWSYIHDIVFA